MGVDNGRTTDGRKDDGQTEHTDNGGRTDDGACEYCKLTYEHKGSIKQLVITHCRLNGHFDSI